MPNSAFLNVSIPEVRISETVLWLYEFFTSFVHYQWRHEMVNVLLYGLPCIVIVTCALVNCVNIAVLVL